MTPRRLGLLTALVVSVILAPRFVKAQGEKEILPIPMFMTEGRDPVYFNISCTTAAWAVVVSSDQIARSTFIESISSNTMNICLSSTTSSQNCDSTAAGPELVPGQTLTDYSRAAWSCKSVTGTSAQVIKGYRTRDRGDYGQGVRP